MIGVWRGEWMKNRTPHTLALKVLIFSDSDQSDLKLDYDAINTKPTTFTPTRKLIPIDYQDINQNLMLFPNMKRSTVTYYLAIFDLEIP